MKIYKTSILPTILLFATINYAPSSACGSKDTPSLAPDAHWGFRNLARQIESSVSVAYTKIKEMNLAEPTKILNETMLSVKESLSKMDQEFRNLVEVVKFERSQNNGLSSAQDTIESLELGFALQMSLREAESTKEATRNYAYNRYYGAALASVGCYGVSARDPYIISVACLMFLCVEMIMCNGFDLCAKLNRLFARGNDLRSIEAPMIGAPMVNISDMSFD